MKRNIVAFFIIALGFIAIIPNNTFGQSGFKAGIIMSDFRGDDWDKAKSALDSLGISTETNNGFTGGFFTYTSFSPNFGLLTELLYTQKGVVIKGNDVLLNKDVEVVTSLHYIEFPISLKLSFPVAPEFNPYLYAGPYASYLILATEKKTDSDTQEVEGFKKFEYGISAGGGISFGLGGTELFIDVRYIMGLADIIDIEGAEIDQKNKGLSLTAGLAF